MGAALHIKRHENTLRSNVARHQKAERPAAGRQRVLEGRDQETSTTSTTSSAKARRCGLRMTRVGLVAPTNSSVLLIGPTGTGKELFARALHERSRRHARPLVRVNCAALPPTLVESELFGHEKGAFTGAVGAAARAASSSPTAARSSSTRSATCRRTCRSSSCACCRKANSSASDRRARRRVDVRVIAATHHDLEAAVAEGRFRADLYYRLSVYPIQLPSLKERVEDIPRLVWFFINRHQRELGAPDHGGAAGRDATPCSSTPGRATSANSRTSWSAR